jgi:hypothetical protein
MVIPIQIRSEKYSQDSEPSITLAQIQLSEMPELIPSAIQVNGKWFVPAAPGQEATYASTWESLPTGTDAT